MALTVRDVERLADELTAGGGILGDSPDTFLLEISEWYDSTPAVADVLDRQTFAQLCECVRSETNPDARRLAIGAVKFVQSHFESRPERARFASRFALRRICTMTDLKIGWDDLPLPEVDASEAQTLFEVAKISPQRADNDLVKATNAFVERFHGSRDIFGRFAHDLELLVDVLMDPEASKQSCDYARAALVYFVETSDVISDDMGPVGLLDDALVVRRAVEHIRPERSTLSHHLDAVVRVWPFLTHLSLSRGGEHYAFSEFMIVNAAFLLTDIENDSEARTGTAIVTTTTGPIAFLIGFARAVAEISRFVHLEDAPEFYAGERLSDRNTGAEVVFDAYGRLRGTDFEECQKNAADHFRVLHPGSHSTTVKRIRPIADLASLRRSTKESGRLRGGTVALDGASTRIGPLERLFSVLSPIVIPPDPGQVLVIAPLGTSEELAQSLTLFEMPLSDVVPMGQARVSDDQIEFNRWTGASGPGGNPVLTVVRSSAEALEIAEQSRDRILGIVGAVRPGSTDAIHLRRLAGDAFRTLAIVEESDADSQEIFRAGSFAFWNWDEGWLRQLRWPPSAQTTSRNPIVKHEARLRTQSTARVSVVSLHAPHLDNAYRALNELSQLLRDRDDDMLEAMVRDGFGALLTLCRHCAGTPPSALSALSNFNARLESAARWWPDEVVSSAKRVAQALISAVEKLEKGNPKRDAIVSWVGSHERGAVVARRGQRELAETDPLLSSAVWIAPPPRSIVVDALLVTGWMSRSAMERILVPPLAEHITLLFYGPERDWYEALLMRRKTHRARIHQLVQGRSAIRLRSRLPTKTNGPDTPKPETVIIDDVLGNVNRARVLRALRPYKGQDPVSAHLVYFAGGHWAAFSPGCRVNSVTHLIQTRNDDRSIREVLAPELRSGDWIVMVRGSDRDALRHAADKILPPGSREVAAEWRRALRRFVNKGQSPADLKRRLAEAGCHRTGQTIRNWLYDDNMIGPKDALNGTVEAIQRATADESLRVNLKPCKEAIQHIRSAHLTVASRLASRVLERAAEWLDADTAPGELVEVEERLVLLEVESMDSEPTLVPRNVLNRLNEMDS